MTFLEYVCTKLLGPADHEGAPGESFWRCPFRRHKNMVFHTLPTNLKHRHYWKCLACDRGGDEFQLLRDLRDEVKPSHPLCRGNYPKHKYLIDKWRREWETETSTHDQQRSDGPRWRRVEESLEDDNTFLRPVDSVEDAWIDIGPEVRELLAWAYRLAKKKGVSLEELAKDCYDFEERFRGDY